MNTNSFREVPRQIWLHIQDGGSPPTCRPQAISARRFVVDVGRGCGQSPTAIGAETMRSQPMMRVVWIAAHLVVASAFHCPHPGLPVNGSGLRFDGRRAWQPLGHGRFDPGELVTYFCRPGRRIPAHQSTVLQCGSDGSWNGTVPRCGGAMSELRSRRVESISQSSFFHL